MTRSVLTMCMRMCIAPGFLLMAATHALAETPEEYVTLAEQAFDKSDIVGAMNHYRKAAEAGYAPAQSRLAYLLDQSEENEEAFEWYKKAVAQNHAEAQFGLAGLYAIGEGTTQDIEQAYQLFTESAKQKYAPAIRVLALAFEEGQLGQRIDFEQSIYWLQQGQLINDYWSIKHLANAYSKGALGLRINPQKAKELEQQLEPLRKKGEQ